MADTLTDDQVAEFREVFCLIDKDSDGFISMEELASVIQTLDDANPIKEDQNMMMMMMVINEADDIERKGKIEDFVNIMARKMQENVVDELKEAFKVFDQDQDGFISANELRQVMMNMGERLTMEEAEQMIREADLDGDGVVSFDEFARIMMVAL
ncbi:hypothetical protein ES332_D08G078700v1 [Gossypium tomentosum]|uniref:EF-hand domain-containing protein n=2 Tax=Gossypium tomentosum TaxID=34277 RepID=A0A5D2JR86_GOSTO|nr:hypothetical protein ES332_D08G078700v1 [Gossypium tomentosum]